MVIFRKVTHLQSYVSKLRNANSIIGFVPTMGALHEGHVSLIRRCKDDKNITVCSIFLNPTQFNNPDDLKKYPVSTESDINLLTKADCDILFLPDIEEIYPDGTINLKKYDFGSLDTILEGKMRPGHFIGVGQVMARLLDIIHPDKLYLGQKDYQQCLIIQNLINIIENEDEQHLKSNRIETIICSTVRESDGLAMSSRNRRLTETNRIKAGSIYQCLVSIQAKQHLIAFSTVKKECEDLLTSRGLFVEYIELATASDLKLLTNYQPETEMIALIAVSIDGIRLIDNILIK